MQDLASLPTPLYPVLLITLLSLVAAVAINIVLLFRGSAELAEELESEKCWEFDTLLPEGTKILAESSMDRILRYEDFDRRMEPGALASLLDSKG